MKRTGDLPVPTADGMPPDKYDEEHSDIDLLSAAPPRTFDWVEESD